MEMVKEILQTEAGRELRRLVFQLAEEREKSARRASRVSGLDDIRYAAGVADGVMAAFNLLNELARETPRAV